MKSAAKKTARKPYERILSTACDLFYRNGYRATGINEIIRKSGVAKATFYDHFPSKEALALAYVKFMNETETRATQEGLQQYHRPYDKLLGILEFLIPWSRERDYRGCAYLNIAAEITDAGHPVRQESRSHYESARALVARLLKELKAERGEAWKNRDVEKDVDEFMLIFTGSLALAQVYHEPMPFEKAIAAVKRLLK